MAPSKQLPYEVLLEGGFFAEGSSEHYIHRHAVGVQFFLSTAEILNIVLIDAFPQALVSARIQRARFPPG